MSNIFSSVKNSLKSAIFSALKLFIFKTQRTSFDKLAYNSISSRLLAYFASEDSQKIVAWSKAILHGDVKKISELYILFGKEMYINAYEYKIEGIACSALHVAAYKGYSDIVTKLIDFEAEVNAQDEKGRTALHLAARKGHLHVVVELMKSKIKVNVDHKDEYGWTALHLAVQGRCLEIVQTLLGSKAEVSAQDGYSCTALHFAAERGYLEIVQTLLDYKAEVNVQDQGGWTALHLAAFNGHLEVVEKLLEINPGLIDIKNKDGNTALSLATIRHHPKVIEFVKSKQAAQNVNTSTAVQDSPNQASGIKSQNTPKTNFSNMQNTTNTQNTP